MTQQAYGYAFVLLMYASALNADLIDNDEKLINIYQLLEARFWQDEYQLYADEISESGELSVYRGQNANMHLCEAMITAYEASNNVLFLKRAEVIAKNICCRQASMTNDLVWEHYTADFQPDWEYNKADPKNLYRPWGFQPGHQTEWTKLLIKLSQHSSSAWLLPKAKQLFDIAFKVAWDHEDGGLIYGFDPKEQWCDTDKYFWVQAESFAAAAMLYNTSEDEKYLKAYQQLWEYSWQHFVDHEHGAWFRLLTKNNMKYSNEKSSAGAKCDYHTLGACFDVLNDMKQS